MFLLFIVYIITVPVDSQNQHLVFVLSAIALCALFCRFGGFGGISPSSVCHRYCFFLRQNLTVRTPSRTRRVPCPRTRGSCGYFGLICAEAGSYQGNAAI